MTAKLRLYSKALRLALLFLFGVLIAGGLFPAIERLLPPVKAKPLRDAVKIRWLRSFSRILNLNVVKHGNYVE